VTDNLDAESVPALANDLPFSDGAHEGASASRRTPWNRRTLPNMPFSRASVPSLMSLIGAAAMGCGGSATGSTPTCVANASSVPSPASVVSGTISGPGISADICSGDMFAYLEVAQGGVLTVINGGFDPGGVRFTIPSDAVNGGLASYYGISAMQPGTTSSTNGDCGNVSFCAMLPTPTTLDCGDAVANCPPGCAPQGPSYAVRCQPVTPTNCYVATSASDCLTSRTPRGSWTLTLTSVGPAVPLDGGVAGESRSEVHGTLSATLEPDPPDATQAPATLRLTF